MKQHKWHKEIKAWADGAEIEYRIKKPSEPFSDWHLVVEPTWHLNTWQEIEYRIKPQKTEPLIISEEPVAVVYSMQDGYVGQMIKKGLPHKTLLYAHLDEPQPKESRIIKEMKSAMADLKKSLGQEWASKNNIPSYLGDKTPTHVKEPQYLYVWNLSSKIIFTQENNGVVIDAWDPKVLPKYIGKIKLDAEDD